MRFCLTGTIQWSEGFSRVRIIRNLVVSNTSGSVESKGFGEAAWTMAREGRHSNDASGKEWITWLDV
jgi:hypothetical protein